MDHGKKTYGRKLVDAAVTGVRKRGASSSNEPAVALILKCLTVAALGTWADTLVRKRPAKISRTAACAAIGFVAAFAWNTRQTAGAIARSASREIGKARDEHWLEMNPIDYA